MTKEQLASHQLTIQDSEFLETMKGVSLNFTNGPNPAQFQKEESDMSLFNYSNDSTVKMQGTFLSSFVTDGVSATLKSGTYGDSMAYTKTHLPMEEIKSEEGDSSSKADAEEVKEFPQDDEEELDRFEEIDVKEVSIDESSAKSSKRGKRKPFLSPEEIEQLHKERGDHSSSNRTQAEYQIQCKDFIESGKYNLDDFKQAMGKFYNGELYRRYLSLWKHGNYECHHQRRIQ